MRPGQCRRNARVVPVVPSDAAAGPSTGYGTTPPARPPEFGAPGASPFIEFGREAWSRLSSTTPLPLTTADVERLRGLGDPIDLAEVDTAYRPLSRLLALYVTASQRLRDRKSTRLNSSHVAISYAVFCLKKKKKYINR